MPGTTVFQRFRQGGCFVDPHTADQSLAHVRYVYTQLAAIRLQASKSRPASVAQLAGASDIFHPYPTL